MMNNWRDELHNLLYLSAKSGKDKMVRVLLQCGCNVNSVNEKGFTPLMCADFTKPKIVKLLLDAGADVNASYNCGPGPLHVAIGASLEHKVTTLESVKLLLDAGANIDQCWNYGDSKRSAVYDALDAGLTDIAELLVQRGAMLNNPNYENT